MVLLISLSLMWCSSQEKEIDFTKTASWSDQVQSGVSAKDEEPIEVIEEDIVEMLDSSSTGNLTAGDLVTGDAVDSLSSIKN